MEVSTPETRVAQVSSKLVSAPLDAQLNASPSRLWTPPARPEHRYRPDSGRSDTGLSDQGS